MATSDPHGGRDASFMRNRGGGLAPRSSSCGGEYVCSLSTSLRFHSCCFPYAPCGRSTQQMQAQ